MATAHKHKEHEGEALIDAAKRSLEDQGERWTGMRSEVFEELARHTPTISPRT